jgi:hypothetical protein
MAGGTPLQYAQFHTHALSSGLELNRQQLGAHSTKKKTSGLVTKILKAPTASAGLADLQLPMGQGQCHFRMAPSWRFSSRLEATLSAIFLLKKRFVFEKKFQKRLHEQRTMQLGSSNRRMQFWNPPRNAQRFKNQ